MTRVDELQNKYPGIPLEIIVKWEVLRNGIRDTEDLGKVSNWARAGAHYSYQTYDHDITLKELAEKWPAWVKPGYMLRPGTMYMKNGIGAALRIRTRSPYEIREIGDGKFALFEGDEKVPADVYFPHGKPWASPEPRTTKGNSIFNLVNNVRRCFRIAPVRYCQYFDTGDECKFCNFNATQKDAGSIGLGRSVTINLEETVEAYKILSSEIRLVEGRLESGGFVSREAEAAMFAAFVEKIASAASYTPDILLHVEPLGRADLRRLKDAGLSTVAYHLEVWDRENFQEVCPGKAKGLPYEQWLEAYLEAVDVFGVGNVGSAFVAGVTMVPPNGHKTWQEARDSLIEGNTWMIKNGVVPTFSNLRMPPGSVYWEDRENHDKYPPTEFYLDAGLAYHKACLENDLYSKMNRFMWCGFDCLGVIYAGDIGMLALDGDVGNWMAKCTSPEMNWLAGFISSVKSSQSTGQRQ